MDDKFGQYIRIINWQVYWVSGCWLGRGWIFREILFLLNISLYLQVMLGSVWICIWCNVLFGAFCDACQLCK